MVAIHNLTQQIMTTFLQVLCFCLKVEFSLRLEYIYHCYSCIYLDFFSFQPVMHGNVDPAVLAALPPSMQLDLLGQVSLWIFL